MVSSAGESLSLEVAFRAGNAAHYPLSNASAALGARNLIGLASNCAAQPERQRLERTDSRLTVVNGQKNADKDWWSLAVPQRVN
jgi:hypothetical protein